MHHYLCIITFLCWKGLACSAFLVLWRLCKRSVIDVTLLDLSFCGKVFLPCCSFLFLVVFFIIIILWQLNIGDAVVLLLGPWEIWITIEIALCHLVTSAWTGWKGYSEPIKEKTRSTVPLHLKDVLFASSYPYALDSYHIRGKKIPL